MFFKEGENCWKIQDAGRVAFLVDGEAYFNAVADAFEAASHAIYIVGWDIDSRIRLRRGRMSSEETFGEFVDRLARQKPTLNIYILEWDFAMLYTMERETWPLLSLGWLTHERVHFGLDDEHPVGASHHQKIVVVDDRVAFVGGFDLASCRWDTSNHAPKQPERVDNQVSYGPFHDVQMLVDGDAASQLGQLVRKRWEQATGDLLPEFNDFSKDPWPKSISPDLKNVPVAILRTLPEYDGLSEVREIEKFYLEAIASANKHIYIENQYFTSPLVCKSLENALAKADGPEVLIVLPRHCSGWLEQETMGALRQRLMDRLHAADQHDRLKFCYPKHSDSDSQIINVHSKLMIVDDELLTIGSANISNRSMGFDTECNLALSAEMDDTIRTEIAGFRSRLLAEHLGQEVDELAKYLSQSGSFREVISHFENPSRTLQPLEFDESSSFINSLPTDEIIDPERPITMERLLALLGFGPGKDTEEMKAKNKGWLFPAALCLAVFLVLMWRWSPLNQWLNMETLLGTAETIRDSRLAIPIVLAIYLVGSCLMFPITVMILATAVTFGPFMGFSLALSGSLVGGLASYLMGRFLGRDVVRNLAGKKLNRLSRKIAKRGWLTIAVVRIVPIAPFTIVNMVAGATHISARSFLIGTAVGMGPGIIAIMIFEGGLERALRNPGWSSLGIAFAAVCLAAFILYNGKRWLTEREERDDQ